MKRALLAATLLALPLVAHAQPIQGLYLGGGGGANWLLDSRVRVHTGPLPGPSFTSQANAGPVALGSLGWAFGNGVRVEAEGSWRRNASLSAGLTEQKYGAMANVLFDMDIGSPYIYPYLGAGAGAQWVNLRGPSGSVTDPAFTYQAMAGLALPIPWVVGLSATTEFRYLGVSGKRRLPPVGQSEALVSGDNNFGVLLGLRYAFHVTPPPVPAPAPVAAAPAPAPARSYVVFFDWDSARLTPRARDIIAEAVRNSAHVAYTRIEVTGHADRTGSPHYNLVLSVHRAEVVASELERWGVPKAAIDIHGLGDTRPLVPTAYGVRQAENRRVEIVYR